MKFGRRFLRSVVDRIQERAREERSRKMWKNFGTALGLLAIAMLSALYSSSAAREARMIPAGISAILALGISIWVGIRFVPRLAANVEWDWIPFLSQYHVTREGWIYLGGIIVVVFAAINTNNNLLYMVLSALLAVLLLSGFLSGVNFRWLKVDLRVPERCFAGESFPISLQIQNRKNVFPTFSLSVESIDGGSLKFPPFYVPFVRAQSIEVHPAEAVLRRRGRHEVKKVKVLSRYPFGFFLKGRDVAVEAKCICYPEIMPQDQLNLAAIDIMGSNERFERGLGNDLYMIRDYIRSDSARHVHWKASAKTATLKTREFAAEESRRIVIYLDRFGHIDESARFEKLVSHAASVALYLVRDGIETALVTDEWSSGFGVAQPHIDTILEYLALVQRSAAAGSPYVDTSHGAMVLSLRHRESVAVS